MARTAGSIDQKKKIIKQQQEAQRMQQAAQMIQAEAQSLQQEEQKLQQEMRVRQQEEQRLRLEAQYKQQEKQKLRQEARLKQQAEQKKQEAESKKRSTLGMAKLDGTIGNYNPEQRKARLEKFHEKRKRRVWRKDVKYDCRKKLADSRPRVKGRFVKKTNESNQEPTRHAGSL